MARSHAIKTNKSDKVFDCINYFLMFLLMVVMIYPFWNTIIVSFNDAVDGIKGNLYLWPRKFTLYNYQNLFQTNSLVNAFFISVSRTVLVTLLNVFFSSMAAYILSRKDFMLKKFMTVVIVATMYINAGLIPTYFNLKDLRLINNFLVYILPWMLGAFNVIVIRTFINGLPESLAESARIDGAGEFRIFIQIIMPLCKPVLATVALWVAVGAWNDWFDTYMYASSKQALSTLPYEMMKLLSSSMVQQGRIDPNMAGQGGTSASVTPNSIRAAITVIASAPIIMIYPFLQKYFVTGLYVGGVKG
jgi:putative aldouronate transport system permease protein